MPALLVVLPLVGACLAPIETPEVASQSFDCPHGLDPEEQTPADRRGEALPPRLQQAASWHAQVGYTPHSDQRQNRNDVGTRAHTIDDHPVAGDNVADTPRAAPAVE